MITSILINGKLKVVDGMKTLSDFEISNWFDDFPTLSNATPYAGYYFGSDVKDITKNSFNAELPATLFGSLDNSSGYISANVDNYLDTGETAPINLTVGFLIKRPAASPGWFAGDFSGVNETGVGFTVGIGGTGGKLRAAGQNPASTPTAVAAIDFPASIAVGDYCAFTAYILTDSVTIAVYNPDTQQYDANTAKMSGTRVAGDKNILIGRKPDNNSTTLSTDISAVVLINGQLATSEHIAVQQYLLAMAD